MKKMIFLTIIILILSLVSNSQITKGNWLVGGTANLSSAQYRGTTSANGDVFSIDIQPKIAHFFVDKFAAGLLVNYSFYKVKSSTTSTSNTTFGFGPFARYYFLQKDSRVNLFVETSYEYSFLNSNTGFGNHSNYKTNSFLFSAGPVIYFNTVVGIEFTVGYLISKYIDYSDHNNNLLLGIGLQVHLEKE